MIYTIGYVVKNTEAYGDVMIKDIYKSITDPSIYCYSIETIDGMRCFAEQQDLDIKFESPEQPE